MNFLRFSFKPLLIFFIILPLGGYSQRANSWQIPSAEPISHTIATLPSNQVYNFSNISTLGFKKLVVTGLDNLWVFDGQNWENTQLKGSPVLTKCSLGNIFIANGNQIEKFELLENNLILRRKLVDTSILPQNEKITSLRVINNNIYFTTETGLWVFSDKVYKINTCNTNPLVIGNLDYLFYIKSNNEVYSINPTDFSLRKIDIEFGQNAQGIVNVVTINNKPILIAKSSPWLVPISSKEQINLDATTYLKSIKAKIIKSSEIDGRIYLLTESEGIVVVDNNGLLISHIKNTLSNNLEYAIDIAPVSKNELLILTPNSVIKSISTCVAGIYPSYHGVTGIPSDLLYHNEYVYWSSKDGLFVSKYLSNQHNSLQFKRVNTITESIIRLIDFKGTIYAFGREGVYMVTGDRTQRILPLTLSISSKHITYTEFNDELWLFYENNSKIFGHCISNTTINNLVLNLPQQNNNVNLLHAYLGTLFVQTSDGSWFQNNLNDLNSEWTPISYHLGLKGNFFIDNFTFKKPLFELNGELFVYNIKSKALGKKIASDTTCIITPLFENGQNLVVKKLLNNFPEMVSIWIYEYSVSKAVFEPKLPVTGIHPSEQIIKATLLPDTTLLLATSLGIRYYSTIQSSTYKPIASIYSASLESDHEKLFLLNGNFINENESVAPKKIFKNRSLRATFTSKEMDQWGMYKGSSQFSSQLVSYEKSWTPWTTNNTREINRLPKGSYTLNVKSKNLWGIESEISSITFTIKPHFFETTLFILGMALMSIIGLFALFSWRKYNHSKVRFKLESLINQRTEELVKEKEKTDNLLARVLPKDTASELKEKGRVNTQRFQVVTVLFCDIEGFTRITEETNPELLIDQLDRFFLYFDSVVEKYRIEKIKTIGDAYMCAGGIPKKNRTNPVEVVLAALEMMHYMRDITTQSGRDQKVWELRIGIDTGPVIAGVVGRNKLSYDIWGSTVNTASRMESSGEVGQINISGNTNILVKDYFICEFRGKMPVKNKGDIQMYFVKGIKPHLSDDLQGIAPNHEFKILIQLVRLGDIEDFLLEKLEKGLPKNLYYHNLKHTVDVYTQVELIGRSEDVSKEDLLILRTAALFHDAGHLIDYDTHEEMAVKLAREILPEYLYSDRQIEQISELIMSTKLPPKPKNILEEIMCDADLDYLGRPDFIPVSNNLYKELHEHGKVGTLREWNELQIKFIDQHSYFTKTARRLRNVNKQSQLDKLKSWLEKN
jgi:class 3 adenylate cyclase